jgi:putative transposase
MPTARPARKYHRLRDYDYASAGLYFITFCTHGKKCFLSKIDGTDDGVRLTLGLAGKIVEEELRITEEKRPGVVIIDSVIMPNHVHLIIELHGDESLGERNEFSKPLPGTVGTIVGKIKSQVTTRLREHYNIPELKVWQERYHDHVIRNESKLRTIQEYIRNNPGKWIEDRYHPDRLSETSRLRVSGRVARSR